MYVKPISTRLVRGRSTPAILAIIQSYPWRCLCFWFVQMTRTTPLRRTILHLSQIRLTDARTFIESSNLADDPAAAGIRRQLHAYPIADQHPHEVAIDSIGNVRHDDMTAGIFPVKRHAI